MMKTRKANAGLHSISPPTDFAPLPEPFCEAHAYIGWCGLVVDHSWEGGVAGVTATVRHSWLPACAQHAIGSGSLLCARRGGRLCSQHPESDRQLDGLHFFAHRSRSTHAAFPRRETDHI